MMLPATLDITVLRGDDFFLPFRLFTTAEDGTKTYVDLTDCTVAAQARSDPDAVDTIVVFEVDVDVDQVTNKGLLSLSLPHSATSVLPSDSRGGWDLQVTDLSGRVTTYVSGGFLVKGDFTR